MSASEKLRALDGAMTAGPWGVAYWPLPEPTHWIGQHDPDIFSSAMLGAVTGSVAEGDARSLSILRNALSLIADVIEAAEALCVDDALAAIGSDDRLTEPATRAARALSALREHLVTEIWPGYDC